MSTESSQVQKTIEQSQKKQQVSNKFKKRDERPKPCS